jgi:hypothetical protein
MTTQDSGAGTDQSIKPQNWDGLDPGADVFDVSGEKLGTVRETMPHYLTIKVHENVLATAEMYVPRELVARAAGTEVHLNRTAADLEQMELKTPPALR